MNEKSDSMTAIMSRSLTLPTSSRAKEPNATTSDAPRSTRSLVIRPASSPSSRFRSIRSMPRLSIGLAVVLTAQRHGYAPRREVGAPSRVLGRGAHRRHAAGPGGRAPRLRFHLERGGVRLRRRVMAGLGGAPYRAPRVRHGDHADPGPDPRVHGHDRHHAGSPLGGPVPPGPGHVRTAGGGGMARRAVRQAPGPNPRVR